MKRPIRRQRQAGQSLILFALAFTFLFGLLVVALDGGMLYVDRRQLQNAADAGALAGAYALESLPLPTYSPAHQTALQIIVDNLPGTALPGSIPNSAGFGPTALGGGYTVTVSATGATGWDGYQVTIAHVDQLQLAPALGFSNPTLSATATARSGTYPFALILLQNDLSKYDNLYPGGNTALQLLKVSPGVAGGGGFSNEGFGIGTGGGAAITFSPCGNAGDLWAVNEDSTASANIEARTTMQQGDPGCPAGSHPVAYPKVQPTPLPLPNYPEPVVTGLTYSAPALSVTSGTTYLCPGTYGTTIAVSATGLVILTPGVYRFTGANAINLAGGTFRSATSADYSGTAPYNALPGTYTNCSGTPTRPADSDYGVILEFAPVACGAAAPSTAYNQFTVSGNGTIDIGPSPKYNHISFYVEYYGGASWHSICPFIGIGMTGIPAGTHVVYIAGNGTYSIRGAIYGPGENSSYSGNGAGYGVGQMIEWTATVVGNGTLKENYDPAYLPYFRGLIQ